MSIKGAWEASASRSMREGVRRFQTRDVFNSCLDLQKRVTKYAFDEEITLSAVMVDATQAWLDARDG